MSKIKSKVKKRHLIKGEAQRQALSSPLRLELLGLFTEWRGLSVAAMASRMGRSATSIHYHVGVLERAGLLIRVGEQPAGKRSETLYAPVAEMIMVDRSDGAGGAEKSTAFKTTSAAFRMTLRDLKTALESPETAKTTGAHRNLIAYRAHMRMSKKDLAELNRRLDAVQEFLQQSKKEAKPKRGDVFVSLTLALLPLRNREDAS